MWTLCRAIHDLGQSCVQPAQVSITFSRQRRHLEKTEDGQQIQPSGDGAQCVGVIVTFAGPAGCGHSPNIFLLSWQLIS